VAQVVERLPSKCEALTVQTPVPPKKKPNITYSCSFVEHRTKMMMLVMVIMIIRITTVIIIMMMEHEFERGRYGGVSGMRFSKGY
jgi:hypothetical protein